MYFYAKQVINSVQEVVLVTITLKAQKPNFHDKFSLEAGV